MNAPAPQSIAVTPENYLGLAELAQRMAADVQAGRTWDAHIGRLEAALADVEGRAAEAARAAATLRSPSKARRAAKDRPPTENDLEQERPEGTTSEEHNLVSVLAEVLASLHAGYSDMVRAARGVRPPVLQRTAAPPSNGSSNGHAAPAPVADTMRLHEVYKRPEPIIAEMQVNVAPLGQFASGLLSTELVKGFVLGVATKILETLDGYYQELHCRHAIEGIPIQRSPIATDAAMLIFERVDAEAEEIRAGKRLNEISPYSFRKAESLVSAITTRAVGEAVDRDDLFLSSIVENLKTLWKIASDLERIFETPTARARQVLGIQRPVNALRFTDDAFTEKLEALEVLDPCSVAYVETQGLRLSAEERHATVHRNTTLKGITTRMDDGDPPEDIVRYVIERKIAFRDYELKENSFYVCKTSAGDVKKGLAPGALEVTPGTRPNVNLDEIVGSGFDQIKGFLGEVAASSAWHDLFVATSPSKSADKSNVLMVGPQGCGKSEVLRAVGGDKDSIGVFAVGSDFLTAWKGEAEKNPKRLFAECVRLQRTTGKHVHILIDEIDTVLAKPDGKEGFGGTNLTTEFQNLMDGVVAYPHLSVWGATNHPEKIPMPMIRRFSKVLIVGELSLADRTRLLEHYLSFMPLAEFRETHWKEAAEKLEGAVGDILRKICDHIWRSKMTAFVKEQPDEAKTAQAWLRQEGGTFNVREFAPERRAAFLDLLRPHVVVKPADLQASIKTHLENMAVHNEIQTAKSTYAKAKEFLKNVQRASVEGSGLILIGGR